MVTPDRRRVAVERLQERFGVSERRACRVAGVSGDGPAPLHPAAPQGAARCRRGAPARAAAGLRAHPSPPGVAHGAHRGLP